MGFAGPQWHEAGLGASTGADYLEALTASASGELIDAEDDALPGDGDRGWLVDDEAPLIDSFLSLGADTLFFEGDDAPDRFGEPVEEDTPPPGGASSVAAETGDLAGDLALPADAGEAGSAPAPPDWLEPDFDFAPTGASVSEADGVASDAPPAGTSAAAGPDPALAADDLGLPGDVIPPPDGPEDPMPVGDVLPAPEAGETGPFTADDGSIVHLENVPDAFEFLLL